MKEESKAIGKKKKKRGEREAKNKKLDSLVTLLNFLFPNLWIGGKMIFNKLNNHHNISSKLTPKKKKELKKKKKLNSKLHS